MATYESLRQAIDTLIKTNGNEEITGAILNNVLNAMITALGANYQFCGEATPSTNPGQPMQNVFYFAYDAGTYVNFGNITLPMGISTLSWDGTSWTGETIYQIDSTPLLNSTKLITSGGVFNAISQVVAGSHSGKIYAGIATPSTQPQGIVNEQPIFYIATQAGTYSHFLVNYDIPLVIPNNGIWILTSSGDDDDWNAQEVIGLDSTPTSGSHSLVESGGVFNELALGAVYDVSAKNPTAGPNNDGKFTSLSALLNDANLNTLIPVAFRKGGMSIKYVQSSDNKYVQYRCIADEFTTNTEDWAIATECIVVDNPEYIKVVLGDDNSIIYAVKPNGDIIFGVGVPSEIRAYILAQIESSVEGKVDKVEGKGLSTNDFTDSLQAKLNALPTAEELSGLFAGKVSKEEDKGIVPLQYFKEVDDFRYVKAVTDAEDNLLLAIDKNGYLVFGAGVPPQIVDYITSILAAKVDKETGKVLISEQYATSVEVIDDPEWMQVTTDNAGNIIEGIKKDGSKYIAKLEGLKKESDIADYDFVKKQEGVNVEKRLIPYTVSTDEDVVNFSNHYNSLIIAFMTDSHIDINKEPSRENFKDAVDYVNSMHVPVSAILCGGDILTPTANSSDQRTSELRDVFALVNDSQTPFLYTKGNHDLNAISVSPSDVVTDDQWGDVYFNRAETEYGIVRKTKLNGKKSGYYYYDIPNFKVRIVCADCYDIDFSVLNDRGRILYAPGDASYIANEQFNWIANTALNFDDKDEKDWGVLVFMHFYRASDVWGTSFEPKFKSVYPAFNNMLAALNSQTDFSEQYTFTDNSFFDLDVSANFSRYANLDKKPYVIGVICGHLHLDINYAVDGIQNIFTANQFCEIAESLTDQRVNRIAGTTTQNLFDLFAIDLHNKKIRAIRYGAGVNCYGNGGDRFIPDGLSF